MCSTVLPNVKSCRRRFVWKAFDDATGHIGSLFQGKVYPKGKTVKRSRGPTHDDRGNSIHGLYFYSSKRLAVRQAEYFPNSYVAKFEVSPEEFLHACEGGVLIYNSAKRVGDYIPVGLNF